MTVADAILVVELQSGSKEAFAELYQRHKYQIYRFCLRMLGDSDSAQDVVQGIFLKIYERCDQIKDPERFRYWLYTVARHDCLNVLRRETDHGTAQEELSRMNSARDLGSKSAYSADLTRLLTDALGRLSPELREAVVLREYSDFSYQEIADITGVKIGLVKFRLFAARKKLAEIFNLTSKGTAKHEL